MNESEALVNEIEYNYSRLNSHRILTLDKKYKISLFTYSEEYYCLEMVNYIFPMRVIIRNVKNEGKVCVIQGLYLLVMINNILGFARIVVATHLMNIYLNKKIMISNQLLTRI